MLDKYPVTGRSLELFYPICGDQFEWAYKEHLSGFSEWSDAEHARNWLVFPENVGLLLSIDETALSRGELYTILSNKEARRRKGIRMEEVVDALKKLPAERCMKNEVYKPKYPENGGYLCELITRIKYLLMTSSDNWTES